MSSAQSEKYELPFGYTDILSVNKVWAYLENISTLQPWSGILPDWIAKKACVRMIGTKEPERLEVNYSY